MEMDACIIQCLVFEIILITNKRVHAWRDERGW
jgi:hypothetical protein